MVVKNAWKFLNQKNAKFSRTHEIQKPGMMVHVDLLGTFYNIFKKYLCSHKRDFKGNREACLSILQEISFHFNKRRCILYLNGFDVPLDDYDETAKKEMRNELNKKKVVDLIKKVEASDHKVDIFKFSQAKKIEWLLKKTFTITNEVKQAFLQVSTEQGWNTIIAPGRAVVAIARVANGKTVVVSNNSDLLFYSGVASVITMYHGKFKCHNILDILASLKISSAALTALAIISGNDYDNHVTGYEINRNYKWILGSKNYTLELRGALLSTKDYVDEYISYLKYICVLSPADSYFLDSYMIFVLLFETLQEPDCGNENNVFENVLEIWKSKNRAKHPSQLSSNGERKLNISLPLERN
ncbi:uncharacterized protein EV154DRAFT_548235 [Mucor mucedo]|uniref:uncharacterized protein n=1 Tax=Mucor mucedo TaxID=29922 RepID=UPI00221E4C86|nr:uncharacterized protein EV154DRAFT_548235 [Mucor mucedo]KAI7895576.1 hypothetical protein EV154DRAFT_548235 [Mucor mucedo]